MNISWRYVPRLRGYVVNHVRLKQTKISLYLIPGLIFKISLYLIPGLIFKISLYLIPGLIFKISLYLIPGLIFIISLYLIPGLIFKQKNYKTMKQIAKKTARANKNFNFFYWIFFRMITTTPQIYY